MTRLTDVARGRDVLARWCNLAEQRLEHLTELFETGRWRRYHSELAFVENIREAKTAVETWRVLSTREASPDNSAVEVSWLAAATTRPPRREPLGESATRVAPLPRFSAEPPPNETSSVAAIDQPAFSPICPRSNSHSRSFRNRSRPPRSKRATRCCATPCRTPFGGRNLLGRASKGALTTLFAAPKSAPRCCRP